MKRNSKGMTITELIVSAVLMSWAMAAIGELVYLNTYASTKLTNTVDGQVGCSRTLRRIAEDVRSARMIGNVYAHSYPNQFPDFTSTIDPYVMLPPSGGWPAAWGAPTAANPYQLSPTTLIVQLPVYYNDSTNSGNPLNGIPLFLLTGSVQSAPAIPPVSIECVDTEVYQVVPDLVNVGTYQLQVARFTLVPQIANQSFRPQLNPPQTVLTGITGPINPATNQPAVFQYLTNPPGSGVVTPLLTAPTPSQPAIGVSINLQVQAPPNGMGANIQQSANHVDAYLRSAVNLRMTNDQ